MASTSAGTVAADARVSSASSGAGGASTSLQRRASSGSFRQSLSKKKPGKKTAPMSHIPGIRPSKHHAKRHNGVLPKYGVHPANADLLAEVSLLLDPETGLQVLSTLLLLLLLFFGLLSLDFQFPKTFSFCNRS